MKKIIITAALLSASIPFLAHAEGTYLGANIGSAKIKSSVDGFSSSDHNTGGKIYGGAQLTAPFGVELGYVNFGRSDKNFNAGVNTGSVSVKPSAVYAAATATAPINDRFSVFGKLGVTENRAKINATLNGVANNRTRNHTDALIGVGATYAVSKEVSAVAEYENFGKLAKDDNANIKGDLLSVGLRYQF